METFTRVPVSTQVYPCGGARLSQSEKNNRHFSRWQTHAVATMKKFPCPSVNCRRNALCESTRNPRWYMRGLLEQRDQLLPRNLDFETRRDAICGTTRLKRGSLEEREYVSVLSVHFSLSGFRVVRSRLCKRSKNIIPVLVCIPDNFCLTRNKFHCFKHCMEDYLSRSLAKSDNSTFWIF